MVDKAFAFNDIKVCGAVGPDSLTCQLGAGHAKTVFHQAFRHNKTSQWSWDFRENKARTTWRSND